MPATLFYMDAGCYSFGVLSFAATMPTQQELLLQECLDQFARQLVEGLFADRAALKERIDDRLVKENSADRRKSLTLLSERVGNTWSQFCETLHEHLVHHALIKSGLLDQDDEGDSGNQVAALKLVDDEQMESDLALSGFSARMIGGVGDVLGDFEGRINRLIKRGDDEESRNPLDHGVLVAALKPALDGIAPEADVRRAFLVMLDPVLAAQIKKQFVEARDWLVDQGVEPLARVRAARPANASGGGETADGMLGALQQFMQNAAAGGQGGAGQGGGPLAGGGNMVAVPAAMLESLNRLQSLDLSALQSGAALEAGAGTSNVLRELRQHDAVRSLPPIEAVTIDIVATLFDFIFDDALVPDSVKALVGRMQIPLLKVAMLDKSFFSNKEHPARALLNEISRASIAAGKDLAHGDPVFEKIRAVVNRVLAESEKEQGIFAELLPEVRALVVEQETKGDQIAEKTRQVAEQQERSEAAEVEAGDAFVRILEGGMKDDVPSHISDFLTRKYPLVMKRALLNGGTAGVAWALATQTLSDLLWTMTPKENPEDRKRLITLLPDLLRRLNAFFDKVGVTAEEKAPFIDALAQLHSKVIKGSRKGPAEPATLALPTGGRVASQGMAPSVVVTRVMQDDGVEVETMTVSGRPAGSRPTKRLDVNSIQRGDWVEFIADNGETLRARLSWTSPSRGVLLFTNPQSSRAVSISPEAMAIQLKKGQAKILGNDPMLERALGKTMESLKN